MWLGDFHLHSTFSDGMLPIPALVDLCGRAGLGAIAITDHLCASNGVFGVGARLLNRTLTRATFPLYREILKSERQRARKLYGMEVIPGYEVTKNCLTSARSAHILALGVDELISPDLSIEDILYAIRACGGVAVAAHPVSTRKIEKQTRGLWACREELAPLFDAWEVASGPYIFTEVQDSGLPMLASSDLHAPKQLRSWKTGLTCRREKDAVMTAIRDQDLRFQFFTPEEALYVPSSSGLWTGSLDLGIFAEPQWNGAHARATSAP